MRPFEASHRVYLVLGADRMNEDAADALLKDLEEPPPYAVVLLVADELGPLPETIRSRCQPVPFHRLSERAIREALEARAPGLPEAEQTALARVAAGRLDRLARLLDAKAAERRRLLLEVARDVYRDPAFEPARAAAALLEGVREHAAEAKAARGGEARRARPAHARGGAARAPRRLRSGARGAARDARGARGLVPGPGGRRRGRARGGRPRRPARGDRRGRDAGAARSAPSGPRSTCARSGARSRSST